MFVGFVAFIFASRARANEESAALAALETYERERSSSAREKLEAAARSFVAASGSARAYWLLASAVARDRRYGEARALARQSIDVEPTLDGWLLLASACIEEAKGATSWDGEHLLDEAQDALTEAGDVPTAQCLVATICELRSDAEGAVEAHLKCGTVESLVTAGNLLMTSGEYERALEAFEKAVDVQGVTEAKYGVGAAKLQVYLQHEKENKVVAGELSAAIRALLVLDDVRSLVALGRALVADRRASDAVEAYRRAFDLATAARNRDHAQALVLGGIGLCRLGDLAAAKRSLLLALSLDADAAGPVDQSFALFDVGNDAFKAFVHPDSDRRWEALRDAFMLDLADKHPKHLSRADDALRVVNDVDAVLNKPFGLARFSEDVRAGTGWPALNQRLGVARRNTTTSSKRKQKKKKKRLTPEDVGLYVDDEFVEDMTEDFVAVRRDVYEPSEELLRENKLRKKRRRKEKAAEPAASELRR